MSERPNLEQARSRVVDMGEDGSLSGLTTVLLLDSLDYALLLEQTVAKGYLAEQALEQRCTCENCDSVKEQEK